jgi:hypothetical protein
MLAFLSLCILRLLRRRDEVASLLNELCVSPQVFCHSNSSCDEKPERLIGDIKQMVLMILWIA